jgi:hypothetical protein
MRLTRDNLLTLPPLKTELIEVPELGGSVEIREWSGSVRREYDNWCNQFRDTEGVMQNTGAIPARWVQLSVVDGDALMFTEAELPTIYGWPAKAIERIATAVGRLNKIGEQEVDKVQAGFPATASLPTGTDSPKPSAAP